MNTAEVYKLVCHSCGETVEVPAGPPNAPQQLTCPRCIAGLTVDWRGVDVIAGDAR